MEKKIFDRKAQRPLIEVEVPTAWCEHPLVGDVHKCFVANLFCVLARLNAHVVLKDIPSGEDFAPRQTDSLLLSYHSVGDAANVWRIKEGPLPYYFSFDRKGYSGWSEFAASADMHALSQTLDLTAAEQILHRVRSETTARNISKYPQDSGKVELTGEFVFFPLQILTDTVLRLAKLDYLGVLERAAEVAESREEYLVLKRHPLCTDEMVAERIAALAEKNKFVRVTTASIHSCLEQARSVICCNSGVGFEALLHGKPVFAFGDSDYGYAAEKIDSLSEIDKAFTIETTVNAAQRDKFLAFFLSEFCFDVRDLAAIEAKVKVAIELAGPEAIGNPREQETVAALQHGAGLAETVAAHIAHHPRIALLGSEITSVARKLDAVVETSVENAAEVRSMSAETAAEVRSAIKEGTVEILSSLSALTEAAESFNRKNPDLDAANSTNIALNATVMALNAANSALNSYNNDLRAALDSAKTEALTWKTSFESILQSRSWRALAPVRAGRRMFHKAPRLAQVVYRKLAQRLITPSGGESTATFGDSKSRKIIVDSGLFDSEWYLVQYGDVAQAQIDPLEHFLNYGAAEGRDPCAFFDTAYYLRIYPDVARAGENPLLHYIKNGSREGRTPHPLFDVEWFVATTAFEQDSNDTALGAYLRSAGKEKIWSMNLVARCQDVFKLKDLSHLDSYLEKMSFEQ